MHRPYPRREGRMHEAALCSPRPLPRKRRGPRHAVPPGCISRFNVSPLATPPTHWPSLRARRDLRRLALFHLGFACRPCSFHRRARRTSDGLGFRGLRGVSSFCVPHRRLRCRDLHPVTGSHFHHSLCSPPKKHSALRLSGRSVRAQLGVVMSMGLSTLQFPGSLPA